MKTLWQTKAGSLVCRWSEVEERVRYNPHWIQEASTSIRRENLSPSVLDFARLSPFGGREWYSISRTAQRLS